MTKYELSHLNSMAISPSNAEQILQVKKNLPAHRSHSFWQPLRLNLKKCEDIFIIVSYVIWAAELTCTSRDVYMAWNEYAPPPRFIIMSMRSQNRWLIDLRNSICCCNRFRYRLNDRSKAPAQSQFSITSSIDGREYLILHLFSEPCIFVAFGIP